MKKNNLDERQEQELLKIEHNSCWIAFWGLLLSILVQCILFPGDLKTIAGEWIVFIALTVYLMIACIRRGIWDRRIQPTPKNNVIASVIAAFVSSLVTLIMTITRIHDLRFVLIATGVTAVVVFILCLAALSIAAKITLKRSKKLNEEQNDDE